MLVIQLPRNYNSGYEESKQGKIAVPLGVGIPPSRRVVRVLVLAMLDYVF